MKARQPCAPRQLAHRAFQQGYRSYSRTYNICSPSARTAITRFLAEGTQLSKAWSAAP